MTDLQPSRPFETSTVPPVHATELRRDQDTDPACWRCHAVFKGTLTRPWSMECQKCHARNGRPPAGHGASSG